MIKHIIKDDRINTLPFGHKGIPKNGEKNIFLRYKNLEMVSMEYRKKIDNLINNLKNEKKIKIKNREYQHLYQ